MYWYATSRRELIVHSIVWQLMFQTSTLSWSQSPSKRKINLNVFLSTNRDLSCMPLARRGQMWSRNPEAKTAWVCPCLCPSKHSQWEEWLSSSPESGAENCPLQGEGEAGLVEGRPVGGLVTGRKRWLHSLNFQNAQQEGKPRKISISSIKKGKISTYQKEEGLCSTIWDDKYHFWLSLWQHGGFPGDASGKESTCQCRKL